MHASGGIEEEKPPNPDFVKGERSQSHECRERLQDVEADQRGRNLYREARRRLGASCPREEMGRGGERRVARRESWRRTPACVLREKVVVELALGFFENQSDPPG